MTIRHHLDEATLTAYATGTLPEAFNLIVAAHVSLCDTCRATLESLDAVGGAVLEIGETAEMDEHSLDHALARLERAATPAEGPKSGTLPAPVQEYVGGDLDAVRWRPIGMGVKQAILPTSSKATARLISIPAGVAMPDHSHDGREMTLVLQGSFKDEDEVFARGDIEVADDDVTHTPVAGTHGVCICLAVTDAPLQFTNWLPRVVGRLARI